MNADFSSQLVPGVAGRDRRAQLPRQQHRLPGRTPGSGENVLLATRSMVPIDGPVREDVGLLGSPCFEIPRSVRPRHRVRPPEGARRAAPAAAPQEPAQRRDHAAVPARALAAGLRRRCCCCSPRPTCTTCSASTADRRRGCSRVMVFNIAVRACWSSGWCWASGGCGRSSVDLRPVLLAARAALEAGYTNAAVQRHAVQERAVAAAGRADRPAGVRRRLRDAGEDAGHHRRRRVLNAGSVIQCHSLEDGSFKSDHTVIGAGATSASRPSCTTA